MVSVEFVMTDFSGFVILFHILVFSSYVVTNAVESWNKSYYNISRGKKKNVLLKQAQKKD